jgi:hypothetical protein
MSELIKEPEDVFAAILKNEDRKTYIEVVKSIQEYFFQGIAAGSLPEAELLITNHFAPGVYMRQMDAKAGDWVVSKMHRTEHQNILLKGAVTLITENGIKTLYAPTIVKSEAGTKRIGYFHEDSSWLTVHPTQETDVEKLENDLTVPEEDMHTFLSSIGYLDKEFIA